MQVLPIMSLDREIPLVMYICTAFAAPMLVVQVLGITYKETIVYPILLTIVDREAI